MYIHRLRKTTMGNGGSMTKRHMVRNTIAAPPMRRMLGSGIRPEVYTMEASRPTQVLSNIRVSKSRMPKKYITFD